MKTDEVAHAITKTHHAIGVTEALMEIHNGTVTKNALINLRDALFRVRNILTDELNLRLRKKK